MQAEAVAISESAIHLNSGDEIFRAETASVDGGFQGQRTTSADRITELPGITGREILGGDGIFGNIPTLESLGKQELEFEFVIVFFAGERVRDG